MSQGKPIKTAIGSKISKLGKLAITLLIINLIAANMHLAKADLGPVVVELNPAGDKPGKAKANTVTAFKILIRINVNIKVHDWVKIWFPTEEASNNIEDICDSLPQLNGKMEHPRFIPNKKYFEKYPQSEMAKYGRMYDILDDRRGAIKFYYGNCSEDSDDPNKNILLPDKSNLGYWLMGTIMPEMPKNDDERFKRLALLLEDTAICYSPCGECMGLPFVTNLCKERSYQMSSPLEIETWRKGYNPFDFYASKTAGIIAPATPGRYRVFVATAPEPTPVESEVFVLPCSRISTPTVHVASAPKGKRTDMSIVFKTGEEGALDKGGSTISIRFPLEIQAQNLKPNEISLNDAMLTKPIQLSKDRKTLTFECPVDVQNFEDVVISIVSCASLFGLWESGSRNLEVWTSSDPEAVKSEPFEIVPQ